MTAARMKLIVVIVALLGAGAWAYYTVYEKPRKQLTDAIAAVNVRIDDDERALRELRGVSQRLEQIAATTLGDTHAEVEARFRRSLGEIARSIGLTEIVANSGPPRAAMNPAGASSPRIRGDFGASLKRGADFYVVQGSLSGVGTLDQVLTVLATVQAQVWTARVGSVTIRPLGVEREQFELRIDGVTTLLMPDLADPDAEAPGWRPLEPGERERWARVVEKNMFRTPRAESPAPPPVQQHEEPKPPPPAPPAYHEWRLTGLPGGVSGHMAGLTNTRTGESRLLEIGGRVLGAQLIEIDRFSVVIEIEGERFEVLIGQTLAERREIQ